MDNIIDLIATDASPAEISDAIKGALFSKSAEKIDQIRPYVANAMFGIEDTEDDEVDYDDNQDQEDE
jgi:chaperonin GroEL (HSP60 family)